MGRGAPPLGGLLRVEVFPFGRLPPGPPSSAAPPPTPAPEHACGPRASRSENRQTGKAAAFMSKPLWTSNVIRVGGLGPRSFAVERSRSKSNAVASAAAVAGSTVTRARAVRPDGVLVSLAPVAGGGTGLRSLDPPQPTRA